MADLASYPYKSLTDARSAMAERLAEFIAGIDFTVPKTTNPFRFKDVFSTWSEFHNRAVSGGGALPVACVLPDRPVYEDSSLTPRSIDETWSGGDPTECRANGTKRYPIGDGTGDGYCLFTFAEIFCPFVVVVRAQTKAIRAAIVRRLEHVFIEDGAIVPDKSQLNPAIPLIPDAIAQPVRYGRVLTVPKHFSRKARFTLIAQQVLDSQSLASENRWMAQLEIEGRMQVCVLRRVRSIKPKVQFVVDGTPDVRESGGT